jgi:hypothetical protein
MSKKVDKSIERTMFHHRRSAAPITCPQCGAALEQDFGPYQIATRRGQQLADEFVMSGDYGYLCPDCPTVVIHTPVLTDMMGGLVDDTLARPDWEVGTEYTVLGLVNVDAIPPDKQHVPIAELDPYPLVLFHHAQTPRKKRPSRSKKTRPLKQRKN